MPSKNIQSKSRTRYKTILCENYLRGECKFGAKCWFAHGEREMQNPWRHPKYKTELCNAYHGKNGICEFGPECAFIHDESEQKLKALRSIYKHPRTPKIKEPEDHPEVLEFFQRRKSLCQ